MFKRHPQKLFGFTLVEITVVIVLIGSIAALAIPQYANQKRRVCNAEAEIILRALYDGQKEYWRDNSSFISATDISISPLLLSFDKPPTGNASCFEDPQLFDGVGTQTLCGNSYYVLASIPSRDGAYSIYINVDGNFICVPSSCSDPVCSKMGYRGSTPAGAPPAATGAC